MTTQFDTEIKRILGAEFRIDRVVSRQDDEVVLRCYAEARQEDVLVHYLPNTPQRLRMHIEFESVLLRDQPCQFLSRVISCDFDGSQALIVKKIELGQRVDEYTSGRELSITEKLQIGKDLIRGLAELERIGIQHLDVCPRNLLIEDGRARLVRSTFLPLKDKQEKLQSAFCYSPEQAGAIARDTHATSDLYSAGVLLFYLLTREFPFVGDSVSATLMAHMTEAIPSLNRGERHVPKVLAEIITKLLQKDPVDRYQTAEAVLFDLEQFTELFEFEENPTFPIGLKDVRATVVEPVLVGREQELRAFSSSLESCVSGEAGLWFLEGVSGAGKSRVLFDFSKNAIEKGWNVFRGLCIQETSLRSLTGLRGVAERLSHCVRDSLYAAEFWDSFEGDSADLHRFFPEMEFCGSDIGDVSPISDLRSLGLLSSFIRSIGTAEKPALVILDDCQWADEMTLKTLSHWWKHYGGHVVVMLVFRSDEVSPEHPIRQLQPSNHFELGPLSRQNICALAESMVGSLPKPVLDLVVDIAGGSPFMASAVVRGLVEGQAISRTKQGWTINQEEFESCLASSQTSDFLIRRLERFDDETVKLLSAAAALGREFDLDTAAHLAGQPTLNAIPRVNQARDRNVLWQQRRGNQYIFSHDKLREALLARLSLEDRRHLHEMTANYLAQMRPSGNSEIAYHFDAAGCNEAALPHALVAAKKSLEMSKFDSAKTQFQIAHRSKAHASENQAYKIEIGLGQVLMELGQYDVVEDHFQAAIGNASSDIECARALGNIAEIQRRRGDIGDAVRTFRKSLEILGFRLPRSTIGMIAQFVVEVVKRILSTAFPSFFVGRAKRLPNEKERLALRQFSRLSHGNANGSSLLQSFFTHTYSLNLGESFLPSPEQVPLYLEHQFAWAVIGLECPFTWCVNRSREIMKDASEAQREGLISHFYSIAYYCTAKYEKAIIHGRRSIELLEQVGDYWKIHMSRYQLAAALYQKGHYREALAEATKNYESGTEKGDYQASRIILDVWARVDPGAIPEETLEMEFSRLADDAQGTCQLLVAKTVNLIGKERFDEALETAEKCRRLAYKKTLVPPYPYAILAWEIAALRMKIESISPRESLERRALVRRVFRRGVMAAAHLVVHPIEKPRMYRELGIVARIAGWRWLAQLLLAYSIRVAKKQGAEFDYAESLLMLGELGLEKDRRGSKRIVDTAQALLNRLQLEHGTELIRRDVDEEGTTISLVDRFDTLLEVGRKISAALSEDDVLEQTRQAALRLLRSEECVIVALRHGKPEVVSGPLLGVDKSIVDSVMSRGHTVVTSFDNRESIICSPISVYGVTKHCLYARHSMIRDLFGPAEERLSEFITALAGASMENSQGYEKLQELNLTLEDRVEERTFAAESRAKELAESNSELERTARELRLTEDQLRQAVVEANSANESKSRFLAKMSHEIRTPMNGILGMTELALSQASNAGQKKYLKVVKQSGQTLLCLLNEILDLSKIEAGKMELEDIRFDVREVIENAVLLLAPSAHTKGIEVTTEFDFDVPVSMLGDPNRLRQIISNLVGNAVKFTSEGEIHVCCSFDCLADGTPELRVAVSDTGIGIAADKVDTIFEAFQQEDSSTTRRYGGSGLGLSICRQLAWMMGGDIEVTSEAGEGSTFAIVLPMREPSAKSQQELRVDELSGSVLALVSQRESTISAATKMLQCLGVDVMVFKEIAHVEDDMVSDFELILVDDLDSDEIGNCSGEVRTKLVGLVRPRALSNEDLMVPVIVKPFSFEEAAGVISDLVLARPTPNIDLPQKSKSHASTDVKSGRILVADDCDVNLEVARGLLEMQGFDVETAFDGQLALDKVLAGHFDIILMDLEMPQMDGIEASREIRQHVDTPIIALSAHAVGDIEDRCKDIGINDYVSKPFDPEKLMATIKSHLSSGNARPLKPKA